MNFHILIKNYKNPKYRKPKLSGNTNLKKVIKFIENKTNIEIIAIGIGHNVNKYYKKAITINDPDQLGGAMIKNFLELFDTKK